MSKETTYRLLNIILLESNFKRVPVIHFGSPDSKVDININIDNKVEKNKLFVTLSITFVSGKEDTPKEIEASVRTLGIFEFSDDSVISTNNFGQINGPAIIFPFIREHIASISLKAGINPIILPIVNFVKLAEERAKSEKTKEEKE